MNKRIVTLLMVSALWQQAALAQRKAPRRDTIRANTIEVIQSYRPEVRQAPKPEFDPVLPPADTSAVRLQYEVPALPLQFTYRSRPLKPLALGRDTSRLPFPNYVKLGGGNLSTMYLDAGIGGLNGEHYETAIHLHHLSQQGNIKNQKSMLSGLEAAGNLRTEGHTWSGGLTALRHSFYNYGADLASPIYTPAQQVLAGARVRVGARNTQPNSMGISYSPEVTASVFGGNPIANEQHYTADFPCSRQLDSILTLHMGLSGSYVSLNNSTVKDQAGMLALRPGVSARMGDFSGHVFLSPTFGRGATYLLPEIAASLQLPEMPLLVQAGWTAALNQNSYERFFLRNPFISAGGGNFAGLLSQNRKDEVYGAVQTHIGSHIALSGRLSWWSFRNLPLFINNPSDRSHFLILQDPQINAVSLQANARYQIGNTFALGLSGIWFNYYRSTVTHVWHEPGLQLKADFRFRPLPELEISCYGLMLDQIYALEGASRAVKLKTVLDLGGAAEYTIIPRLSAFVQINNLLNNNYQRWYNYPAYGFNIFGGLRLKF
jgi:outer membrane receptor protein involved in Fe transport